MTDPAVVDAAHEELIAADAVSQVAPFEAIWDQRYASITPKPTPSNSSPRCALPDRPGRTHLQSRQRGSPPYLAGATYADALGSTAAPVQPPTLGAVQGSSRSTVRNPGLPHPRTLPPVCLRYP